jgi:Cyclic nucleotide-binding domain
VLDTTLPRPLAARLLEAVEEVPALPRAQAVARRTGATLPTLEAAIGGELRGADALSRRILLEGLPPDDLLSHRDAIAAAAHQLARAADPHRLLRRLAHAADEGADMPSPVETLLALSKVPLLSGLSTRQLDALARRTRWRSYAAGQVVAARGQPLDALLVIEDGELCCGDRRLCAGELVDDLAWMAPRPPADDVIARRASRLLEIDRAAFEELADDVPGLGASLCRALAERLRAGA